MNDIDGGLHQRGANNAAAPRHTPGQDNPDIDQNIVNNNDDAGPGGVVLPNAPQARPPNLQPHEFSLFGWCRIVSRALICIVFSTVLILSRNDECDVPFRLSMLFYIGRSLISSIYTLRRIRQGYTTLNDHRIAMISHIGAFVYLILMKRSFRSTITCEETSPILYKTAYIASIIILIQCIIPILLVSAGLSIKSACFLLTSKMKRKNQNTINTMKSYIYNNELYNTGRDQSDIDIGMPYKDDNNEMPTCSVCQDEFQNDDEYYRLPCKHDFHSDCVRDWLTKNPRCPYCRKSILLPGASQDDNFFTAWITRELMQQE